MAKLSKTISSALLKPLAGLSLTVGEPFKRAWSHARLAARITTPLDPSVVILGTPEIHGTANIIFGTDLYLYRELYFETQQAGEILIGNDVVISRGVHIVSFASITIGDGTMIGEYSSLRDANHRTEQGSAVRESGHIAAPIFVGRNVWIGRGVMILPGVTIGDGAVVGANAVVSRDVPAGVVVVGVPAKQLTQKSVVSL
jgi:acetyltransferase-like isoleucine patch superfamily enzyme